MTLSEELRSHIREVQNFPINGISFKDISPIFLNPGLVRRCTEALIDHWKGKGIDKVVGIDSRGFLFGPQIATGLDVGFVLIRKKGKLPPETVQITYALEYGEASIESVIHSIKPGDRVLIHDDLLATAGTALAAAALVEKLGGVVAGFSFLIDLSFLKGAARLAEKSEDIHALIAFDA
jgi:adenine phosphoribosyltransferase